MGKGTNTAVILLDVEPRDGRSPRFLAHDDALQHNRRRARNEDALEDGLLLPDDGRPGLGSGLGLCRLSCPDYELASVVALACDERG